MAEKQTVASKSDMYDVYVLDREEWKLRYKRFPYYTACDAVTFLAKHYHQVRMIKHGETPEWQS